MAAGAQWLASGKDLPDLPAVRLIEKGPAAYAGYWRGSRLSVRLVLASARRVRL